jgi:hypothetical protein
MVPTRIGPCDIYDATDHIRCQIRLYPATACTHETPREDVTAPTWPFRYDDHACRVRKCVFRPHLISPHLTLCNNIIPHEWLPLYRTMR